MATERKVCTYNTGRYCVEGCMLRLGFEHQATKGGYLTDERDTEKPCGPYWPRKNWQNYIRELKAASENGCACSEELIQLIDKVEAEKEMRGEIIEEKATR